MKSIGLFEAFLQEIKRKIFWILENRLYVFVYFFVFICIGTVGLWGENAFVAEKRNLRQLYVSFNAINLTKYASPILTAIISDWILKLFSKTNGDLPRGKKTFYIFTFSITIFAVFLMVLGLSFGANEYSYNAVISTVIVLIIYFFSYCENELYEDNADPKSLSSNNVPANVGNLHGGGL